MQTNVMPHEALQRTAREGGNIFGALMAAVRVASLGQILTLYDVGGSTDEIYEPSVGKQLSKTMNRIGRGVSPFQLESQISEGGGVSMQTIRPEAPETGRRCSHCRQPGRRGCSCSHSKRIRSVGIWTTGSHARTCDQPALSVSH